MNKLNHLGETLLDYKTELVKEYPPLVREAMIKALTSMVNDEEIDESILPLLIDNNETKHSFKKYLNTQKPFLKPHEELVAEFNILCEDLLVRCENYSLQEVYAEPDVDKDEISSFITFTCTEEYVMDHFGVSEQDLIKLMKKGGFIEMFVSLRMSKVLKDIISTLSPNISYLSLDHSLPYVNSVNGGYSIDFMMVININDYEKDNNKDEIFGELRFVVEKAREIFGEKF